MCLSHKRSERFWLRRVSCALSSPCSTDEQRKTPPNQSIHLTYISLALMQAGDFQRSPEM